MSCCQQLAGAAVSGGSAPLSGVKGLSQATSDNYALWTLHRVALRLSPLHLQALEFQASQRTWQLQQDAHQAAAQAQMKHEIAARQAGIAARRRQQLVQWAEDEERQLQHSEVRLAIRHAGSLNV